MKLILASSSPRRKELMETAGYSFNAAAPDVEESSNGFAQDLVIENARRKARAVPGFDGSLVIGADTIVECGPELLGKPLSVEDASRMIELQLDRTTRIYTGIVILDTSKDIEVNGFEISEVVMNADSDSVARYLGSGLWKGKAGAFGIQDPSSIDIALVSGELDNVIGMPMILLERLLGIIGYNRSG